MKKNLSFNKAFFLSFLLILGLIFIYFPSFKFEFNLDDHLSSAQNKWVQQGFVGINEIFTMPYLDEEDARYGGYRPIPRVTHAIEFGLWGNKPYVAHGINFALYLLCCYLGFLVLQKLIFQYKISSFLLVLGIGIFAFHPLHVEAVASLKNREVLLAFIFGLLLMLTFLRQQKNALTYFLSFLFILCGLCCKLDTIIFPLFIFLILLFNRPVNWLKNSGVLLTLLIVALGINYGIQQSFPQEINLTFSEDENPMVNIQGSSQHLSTVAYISLYLSRLVLIPDQQLFFYGAGKIDLIGWNNIWVILSLIIHIFFFVFSVRLFYKKNILGLLLLMYFACIGLNSNLIIPIPGIIADRILFTILLPFAAILIYLVDLIQQKWKSKLSFYIPLIPLFLFLGISFFYAQNRVPCWKNPYTLGQCDMPQLKDSIIAQTIYVKMLGGEIEKAKNTQHQKHLITTSLAHSRRILELNPQSIVALNHIGSIYCEQKDSISFGSKVLYEAMKIDPNNPIILRSLGNCFNKNGDTEGALKFYEAALTNADYNIELRFKIFNVYLQQKDLKKAQATLEEMTLKAPNDKTTLIASGMWDIVNGRPDKATQKFEAIVKKHPEMTELKAMIKAYYDNIEN